MSAWCKSSRHLSATGICESEFAIAAVIVPFSDRRGRYAFASRVARESERELSRRPHLRRRLSRRGRRVAVWKRSNRLSNVGPIRDIPLYRPPKTFGVSPQDRRVAVAKNLYCALRSLIRAWMIYEIFLRTANRDSRSIIHPFASVDCPSLVFLTERENQVRSIIDGDLINSKEICSKHLYIMR